MSIEKVTRYKVSDGTEFETYTEAERYEIEQKLQLKFDQEYGGGAEVEWYQVLEFIAANRTALKHYIGELDNPSQDPDSYVDMPVEVAEYPLPKKKKLKPMTIDDEGNSHYSWKDEDGYGDKLIAKY